MRRTLAAVACAALTVTMLQSPVAAAAAADHGPRLSDAKPCDGQPGFTCATLTVPLDHRGRTPGRLELRVAYADNANAKRGVLLALAGGPGQAGLRFDTFKRALAPVLDDHQLVMIDQRGTGVEGALDCPQLQAERGILDYDVPTPAAVRECARSVGSKRQFFATADTVDDLELLRRALGAKKWTIDGISYGTYVASRYAIKHPSRVKKLVLDSVVPHTNLDAFVPEMLHANARVLREACAATGCTTDPAADLAAVVRATDLGPQLLNTISVYGIVDPNYSGLPQMLAAARAGNLAPIQGLIDGVFQATRGPADDHSQGLMLSTLCAEERFPWGNSATPEFLRQPLLDAASRRLAPEKLWPFDQETAKNHGIMHLCLPYPRTAVRPVAQPYKLPPVPALLLAGTRDLSTPVEWARWQLSRTPRGELVVLEGFGHSVQSRTTDDRGRKAVEAFLDRG